MSQSQGGTGLWESLTKSRGTMLSRKERQAKATIPSTLTDKDYQVENNALTNGFTSLGNQGATNIVNKLMLAMFAPGVTFMKLEIAAKEKAAMMAAMQLEDDSILTDVLASGEQDALKAFEASGSRPALYEGLAALVCVGDVLMDLSDTDRISFVGLHDYAVKRNRKGVVTQLIMREITTVGELDDDASAEYRAFREGAQEHEEVTIYTVARLKSGMYRTEVYIDDVRLSKKHEGKYKPENLPYRALTWRLPTGQSYGVSLAEDYSNDLGVHDVVSEALADGAVLAAQFRWACDPGGITQPEDISRSRNGAVIAAKPEDLKVIFANIGQQLSTVASVAEMYQQRIGRGFLMNTMTTRNSERTTAEEVKIQAIELEQSMGGVYSRQAIDIQGPISRWMLRKADIQLNGTKIEPVIITGLDALSRSAELERLKGFLGDVALLSQIQPEQRQMLNEQPIISEMAAGRGIDRKRFVASPQVVQQRMDQQAQAEADQMATQAGVEAGAQQMVNEGATQ